MSSKNQVKTPQKHSEFIDFLAISTETKENEAIYEELSDIEGKEHEKIYYSIDKPVI